MSLSTQNARKNSAPHLSPSNTQNKSQPVRHSKSGVPLFLQKAIDSTTKTHQPAGLATAINHSKHSGSGLAHHSKSRFESTFGSDLSGVRIHNGSEHNQLAKSLNAKAFTTGSDIFFGEGHYRPGTQDGDRLLAHELTHVMQQSGKRHSVYSAHTVSPNISSDTIQRDEDEDQQGFDYNLLPPSLSYRNGPFGMSADTSAAQLSYFSDEGRANLGYQYGGDLFYGANMGGLRSRFGVNPQSGVGSMSFGGAHEGFRFGLNANTAGNFGLNLGYGSPLLPMPNMLGQQAGAAWQGASAMGGALPDFASNPMAAYDANREHIGAMGAFGSSLGSIYGQQGQGGLPFGAGLSLSYNPEQRWVLGAGVQGSF